MASWLSKTALELLLEYWAPGAAIRKQTGSLNWLKKTASPSGDSESYFSGPLHGAGLSVKTADGLSKIAILESSLMIKHAFKT